MRRGTTASSIPSRSASVWYHLVGQPLGVQPPALDVGRAGHLGAEGPEAAQILEVHLDRDLEVVAGRRLVEGDGRDLVQLRWSGW